MQSAKRFLGVAVFVFSLLVMTNTALAKDVWFYTDKGSYGRDDYYLISETVEQQDYDVWGCKVKQVHNGKLIATHLYLFFQDSERGGIGVSGWSTDHWYYIGPVTSWPYYVKLWKAMQPYI